MGEKHGGGLEEAAARALDIGSQAGIHKALMDIVLPTCVRRAGFCRRATALYSSWNSDVRIMPQRPWKRAQNTEHRCTPPGMV